MHHLVIEKSIMIDAPAARVWDMLVNPVFTQQYMFGCEAVSKWRVGSTLLWQGALDRKIYVKGTIVNIMPKKRLEYTTIDPRAKYEDIPANYTTVRLLLDEKNGKTRLSVWQGDYATVAQGQQRYEEAVLGWDAVLPKLKEIAEQKK